MPREERDRIADASPEVEHRSRLDIGAPQLGHDVDDFVLGEILGILAGQPDIGRVHGPVLVGELVELDLVHHSLQTSRYETSCMPRAATSSRIRGLIKASRSAAQAYCQSSEGRMCSSPGWHMSSTVPAAGKLASTVARLASSSRPPKKKPTKSSLRRKRLSGDDAQNKPSAACSATRRACRGLRSI